MKTRLRSFVSTAPLTAALATVTMMLITATLGATAHAATVRCESIFTGFENPNTRIAAATYSFEHTRSIGHYHFFLRESFKESYAKLGAGDLLIDLGAGLGVAGMQTVRDQGSHVVVINAQNFPRLWQAAGRNVRAQQANSVKISHRHLPGEYFPDEYTIDSIGGLPRSAVSSVANAFYLDVPNALEKPRSLRAINAEDIARVTIEAMDEYDAALKDPRFKYRVGFAEDVLPQYKNASMITDVFGAFYYSSHRATLLDQIRAALKPGASAYLSIVGFNERGINDVVRLKNGTKITLFDYLLKYHANEFRIEGAPLGASKDEFTSRPTVLVFTPKNKEPLRLQPTRALPPFRNGAMEVPQLEYREI
jgi:hypothetical protein